MNNISKKICNKCHKELSIMDFYPSNKTNCIKCLTEYTNNWRKNNRDKINLKNREKRKLNKTENYYKHIKNSYDLDKKDYWAMFYEQHGKCAICGKEGKLTSSTKHGRLYVDHNHATGKVRGLLCMGCNSTLGMAKEDIEILNNCANYLLNRNSYIPNYEI